MNKVVGVVFAEREYINNYPSNENVQYFLGLMKQYRFSQQDRIKRAELALKFNGYCPLCEGKCSNWDDYVYADYLVRKVYEGDTSFTVYSIYDINNNSFGITDCWG